MITDTNDARWKRLIALLEPFHQQAMATARRLCRSRADGDDLYQEAVLRAFDKLHTLRDESRFRSWFYATLLSRHRDRHRRSFWRRFLPLGEALPGDGPIGEDGSEWHEETRRANRAAQALSVLPEVQREAVVLFELDGHSIEEIAAMQRTTVSAVKSRLSRGRERLRRYYETHGGNLARPAVDAGETQSRRLKHQESRGGGASEASLAAVPIPWPRKEPSHE